MIILEQLDAMMAEVDPDNPVYVFKEDIEKLTREVRDKKRSDLDASKNLWARVKNLLAVVQSNRGTTIETNTSFKTGKFELSDDGVEKLNSFLDKTLNTIENFVQEHPGEPVPLRFQTVGYTDSENFSAKSTLKKKLIEMKEEPLPQKDPERRQELNKRLSETRAIEVMNYLTTHIRELTSDASFTLMINKKIVAKGEELPPGLEALDDTQDKRRRICKVYSYLDPLSD